MHIAPSWIDHLPTDISGKPLVPLFGVALTGMFFIFNAKRSLFIFLWEKLPFLDFISIIPQRMQYKPNKDLSTI